MSLKYKDQIKKINKELAKLNNYEAYHLSETYEKALAIYQESKTLNYFDGMAEASHLIGNNYFSKGEYQLALNQYQKALSISQTTENVRLQFRSLSNIGIIFLKQGLFSNSLFYHLGASRLFEKYLVNTAKNNNLLNMLYSNIGTTLMRLKLYEDAEKYLYAALNITVNSDHDRVIYLKTHSNVVILFNRIGRLADSKKLLDKMEKAIEGHEKPYINYVLLTSKAHYNYYIDNFEAANNYFNRAFNYCQQNLSALDDIEFVFDWCALLSDKGRFTELESLLVRIEAAMENIDTSKEIDVLLYRYIISKSKGKINEALEFLEKANILKDEYYIKNQQLVANGLVHVTNMQAEYLELSNKFNKDTLTRCYSRDIFEKINSELKEYKKAHRSISLIMMDIDCFKQFNDNYGHSQGDKILRQIAGITHEILNEDSSYFIRYGGDEFIIILLDYTQEMAELEGRKIQESVKAANIPHSYSSVAKILTVTMGIKSYPYAKYEDITSYIDEADIELYRGKSAGRDCIYSNGRRLV